MLEYKLPKNLEQRFALIRETVLLFDQLYGASIRKGVAPLILADREYSDIEYLLTTGLKLYRESRIHTADAEILLPQLDFILKNAQRVHRRDITLRNYPNKVGNMPYFIWNLHKYIPESREIDPLCYIGPDGQKDAFAIQLIFDRNSMRTNYADAMLGVDSADDFIEGYGRHDWIWFREGAVVYPDDLPTTYQPAYRDLDHALETIANNIKVPADLLRYIIANSNLTSEQKRSTGFDRPEFIKYKF